MNTPDRLGSSRLPTAPLAKNPTSRNNPTAAPTTGIHRHGKKATRPAATSMMTRPGGTVGTSTLETIWITNPAAATSSITPSTRMGCPVRHGIAHLPTRQQPWDQAQYGTRCHQKEYRAAYCGCWSAHGHTSLFASSIIRVCDWDYARIREDPLLGISVNRGNPGPPLGYKKLLAVRLGPGLSVLHTESR